MFSFSFTTDVLIYVQDFYFARAVNNPRLAQVDMSGFSFFSPIFIFFPFFVLLAKSRSENCKQTSKHSLLPAKVILILIMVRR